MTDDTLPASAKGSPFGWPQPGRVEEFRKLLAQPQGATDRIIFQGQRMDLPIIRVPIDLPKYRLTNGRTVSLQAEYLATNPAVRRDLFSGDPELWEAQEAQHGLLLKLATESDLQQYFEKTTNKQVNPIVLDENGFVVNGNRRLATWRQLVGKDGARYEHFKYIDVIVLPHSDEKELDRLEARLQIAPDIKADYSWDNRANMMLAKQQRDHFSNKELAELYDMKESEVQELFDMRRYADEYLRARSKPDVWSLVEDQEFAFRRLVASRGRVSGVGAQELFKELAYVLIDNPTEVGGRLYEAIPAIVDCLEPVKEKLQEEFAVTPPSGNAALESLFGGPVTSPHTDPMAMQLAKEIQKPENYDKVREIIVDVIETQRQLKKDAKSANYLLECCTKAHAWLTTAVKAGLRPESKRDGVDAQLTQIETQVGKIREFLKQHVKH